MTRIEKKVEQFIKNPASIEYRDLEQVLIRLGFEKIQAKGSHMKFKHARLQKDLIIPVHNGKCKDFYKKEARKRIGKLLSGE